MDAARRQLFEALPGLGFSPNFSPMCKVCGAPTRLFDAVDFNKCCSPTPYQFGLAGISVPYYRCENCRFLFTDLIDEWSSADIAEIIYNADYIKVDPDYVELRPRRTAAHLAPLHASCKDVRILDFGSGSGVFAQAMATHGFKNVQCYDPFSSPAALSATYDLVTCIEVLEHAAQPLHTLTEIAEHLSETGVILIGQTLQPENIEEVAGRWWYVAPRNGHVSFYTHETFLALAERAHLKYQGGSGLYAFSRERLAEPLRQVIDQVRQATRPEDARLLRRNNGLRAIFQRKIRRMFRGGYQRINISL